MPRHHRAEVAQVVWPDAGLAQINFRDGDGAPLAGLGDGFSGLIKDRRNHPAILRLHEGAADKIDVILAGAGLGCRRGSTDPMACWAMLRRFPTVKTAFKEVSKRHFSESP